MFTSLINITLAIASTGILNGGFVPNMLDICPKYAGILYGCSNMAFSLYIFFY